MSTGCFAQPHVSGSQQVSVTTQKWMWPSCHLRGVASQIFVKFGQWFPIILSRINRNFLLAIIFGAFSFIKFPHEDFRLLITTTILLSLAKSRSVISSTRNVKKLYTCTDQQWHLNVARLQGRVVRRMVTSMHILCGTVPGGKQRRFYNVKTL